VKSGEFRPDLDVPVVSYGLLGMLNWLYKWYDPNGRLGVREVADQFSALALGGLAAAAPPTRPSSGRRGGRRHRPSGDRTRRRPPLT
jgi:hypothetical protein